MALLTTARTLGGLRRIVAPPSSTTLANIHTTKRFSSLNNRPLKLGLFRDIIPVNASPIRTMATTAGKHPQVTTTAYDMTTGHNVPIWMLPETYKDRQIPKFPKLEQDIATDVCIVGGGIAGLTTAYLALKSGQKVVLLEDGEIASAESGRTTAHLMSAVDDRYFMIEKIFGANATRIVRDSHTWAIDQIEQIAKDEGIDCEFERLDGYLFLSEKDVPETLHKETLAAEKAGWTDIRLVERVPLPDPRNFGPALVFPNQGQFHPVKYYDGLAKAISRMGGKIYTHTHDSKFVGGSEAHVTTQDGKTVQCSHIVVATNMPVNDRVTMYTKESAWRSFVITAAIPRDAWFRSLYWDTNDPYNYVRCANYTDTHDILIIGGGDRRTGQIPDYEEPYRKLEEWARARFPKMGPIMQRWSGQVMEPVDMLGYLGRNPSDKSNVYIITGDSGNGMTHCTIGAKIITDMINERENPEWAKLYDPARIPPVKAVKEFVVENVSTGASYTDWLTRGEVADIEEIPFGEGRLMRSGLKKLAIYKDESGKVFKCDATCPHLKAIVHWNNDEKSWDCPAHGSRFDCFGHVYTGPANEDLTRVDGDQSTA